MLKKILDSQRYTATAIYYAAFISLGLTTASLGPTLQGLADNTHSTLAQISSLFFARAFGYLLGSLSGGRIYDRVKGHPIMAGMLLIMAVMMAAAPLTTSLWFLGFLLLMLGLAEGTLDVGANTLIVWQHGDRVPPFMNGLHAFFGIGTTISPLIVAFAISINGHFSSVYWISALLILPVAISFFKVSSPSSIHISEERSTQPILPLLLILTVVMVFLYVGAEVGFAGWIYTYTTSQSIADPAVAAGINSAYWAAFTLGRVLSIPLAARLKPNRILGIDLLGCALSVLLIIIFPGSLNALWIGSIGTGLFMASVFPTILNDAQSRMAMTGKITSWFFVAASLGNMFLPWLIGQISPASAMIIVFIAIVMATIVFVFHNFLQRTPLPHSTQDSRP